MRNFLVIFLFPAILFSQVKEMDLAKNWKFRKKGDKEWLPASVPGTVHTDLFANQKIKDPFAAGAEKELQWIENEDWEYATEFDCDPALLKQEVLELIFEGLDTYASVYLNDSLLLNADNMFRSWPVNVKKYLKEKNRLAITFTSSVKKGKELAAKLSYTLPEGERVFTRKAQYHYGWDFAPRFVTCGIWKGVKLMAWNRARLLHVGYSAFNITDTLAALNFTFDIQSNTEDTFTFEVRGLDRSTRNTGSSLNTPVAMGTSAYEVDYFVRNPKLWWCNGYGTPNLYGFKIDLLYKGKIVDTKYIQAGIREVKLIREDDAVGQSFYFKLNGVPIFMKGANLVPQDVFLPRVKRADQQAIVLSAVEANMNMLRVWGGGIYADDEFYSLCDQKGILVWQDMMFACAMYPGDEAFVKNVRAEVGEQVKRISAHPSLAIICGNNESDEGWNNWGWQKQFKYSKSDSERIYRDYKVLFEGIIPQLINDIAPLVKLNYVPSSPGIGWGHHESLLQGDAHYWGVWWGMEPFEVYEKKVGRFMSEYGFQSIPEHVQYGVGGLKSFQKHPRGFETIEMYMKRDFNVPKDPEKYAYVSQLVQARGLQVAMEAHRRAKPNCMGSLFWQLNDCWPGITWSSLGYKDSKKAAWYTVKRAFQEILVSVIEEKDSLRVYIISDHLHDKEVVMECELLGFDDEFLWKNYKQLMVKQNSSRIYLSIPNKEFEKYDKTKIVFRVGLTGMDHKKLYDARYYFLSPSKLQLQKPSFQLNWKDDQTLEISSNTLARAVFLDAPGVETSDNFFDLLPGERKKIKIKGGAKPKIRITSLADANQP